MNKRIINIAISLNEIAVSDNEKLPQCDKNTHFINLKFLENVELSDYQLLVFYKLPYPDTRVLVDSYENLTTSMNILIPNEALKRSGELTVEFSLKKNDELITVNKNIIIKVISTLNAVYTTAIATGNLNKTIDEQVEEIKKLLEDSKKDFKNFVDSTSKENIDEYIEANSKPAIDSYVKLKEETIKGATFTPAVAENGDLSWTNDKNLPNPPIVNIKGPKGEPGTGGGGSSGGITQQEKEEIDKKIHGTVGKYDGVFPLTEAVEGNVYLVPQTGKFYKCSKTYKGTQLSAPNSDFEDLSVLENRNRLDNLFGNTKDISINLNIALGEKINIPEIIGKKLIQIVTGSTNYDFTETRVVSNTTTGLVFVSSIDPLGSVTYSINFITGDIKVTHIYGEGTHNNWIYKIQVII